ncbi:uncharacterized protein V1510DRAFT_409387 [Dipodascopsis tothii]|uniref:uncharacterized protein n=1 Tax=Dipodascopsis tothii TaxID=44089 RepID=UPI0034CEAD7F
MNSLFNQALKQSQLLRRDIDTFSTLPATAPNSLALQGQISATLATLTRTIDDYDTVARRELVPEKQSKAFDRIKNFRQEAQDARSQFEKLKQDREDALASANRSELFGRRTNTTGLVDDSMIHANVADNPYASATVSGTATRSGNFGLGSGHYNNDHTSMPSEFINRTGEQLDEFIERGRMVLGDLMEQKTYLKSTQKKLYSAANTLGISNDTIRYIERRARQDKLFFYGGALFCIAAFYFVIKLFR